MNGFPIEHAKSGGANNANNDNGDENEALGKQTFATAELKNQSQQEGYSGHDEALSILRGESPLNSDTGSYITDSCYYGTNYNRGGRNLRILLIMRAPPSRVSSAPPTMTEPQTAGRP